MKRLAGAFVVPLVIASARADNPDAAGARADEALAALQRLSDAIGAAKPAAIVATFGSQVRFEGLAYTDPACTKRFGAKGKVEQADRAWFARCLLTVDGIHELAWLSGVEGVDPPADPRLRGPRGTLEGWVSPRRPGEIVRIVATIVPPAPIDTGEEGGGADPDRITRPPGEIIPRIRRGSLEVPGDAATKGKRAYVELCFDRRGDATSHRIRAGSGVAAWDARADAQASAVAIKPFQVGGEAAAVCTELTFTAKVR